MFWGQDREPMPVGLVLDWLGEAGFTGARSFPLTERSTCIVATRAANHRFSHPPGASMQRKK